MVKMQKLKGLDKENLYSSCLDVPMDTDFNELDLTSPIKACLASNLVMTLIEKLRWEIK